MSLSSPDGVTEIGDARIVLLGESTHGTHEAQLHALSPAGAAHYVIPLTLCNPQFYAARAQITKLLVERKARHSPPGTGAGPARAGCRRNNSARWRQSIPSWRCVCLVALASRLVWHTSLCEAPRASRGCGSTCPGMGSQLCPLLVACAHTLARTNNRRCT